MRAYLEGAPPGSRMEWLQWHTALAVSDLPIAAPDQCGRVVTLEGLQPAAQVVAAAMRQDRNLCGGVLRKSIVNLRTLFNSQWMAGDFGANIELADRLMGVEAREGSVEFLDEQARSLPEIDAQGAKATAGIVTMLMQLLTREPSERQHDSGWPFYAAMFTRAREEGIQEQAFDFIAWVAVMIARLRNSGHLDPNIPFLTPVWRNLPRLSDPGWYPNPQKHGEIVDGISQFQRYWDGPWWTDRVRILSGREWKTGSVPIDDPSYL